MLFITCSKSNDIKPRTSPPRGVLLKRCSANPQQMYSRAPMQMYYTTFFGITFPYGSFPVNLLHICRTHFEEKLWGTASENNSFVQVNCKYWLHKLKWTNLILQKICWLFVGLQVTTIWSVNYKRWLAKYAT